MNASLICSCRERCFKKPTRTLASPRSAEYKSDWIDANGDIRRSRSRGWRGEERDFCMVLVSTVFIAARIVPRKVRTRPRMVK